MTTTRISARLLLICTVVACACAKEYILEDLLAVETGSTARRNVQQQVGTTSVRNSETRAQKNVRATGDKTNSNTASNGSETSSKDDDDEDKKTLAQQVADGKYGLIQKEIFVNPPERPGIISYEVNPEVPKDNVNNLGGLKPDEIWLAENHLLVLAGGGRYDDNPLRDPNWRPIDDYKAPPRQVKIPPEPKVPPPFPVQLRPGGPTEFIRGINGTGGPPPFPFFPPPPPGNYTGGIPTPFFGPPINIFQGNFTPGNGPLPPFPFPPLLRNGSIPFGPGGLFPPGVNFPPPPPVNLTEQLDEDDPSIYYPPPYDFVYKRDNTTAVPPGPLVPGIVLPPPPDFFAPLDDDKRKAKPAKRPAQPSKPKRPRPVVVVTTTPVPERPRYFYTTTKRPAVKIVTDDPSQHVDLNEVTPTPVEHALPPDAVVQGWVPIPAPRPFYITGIRKPAAKGPLVDERPRYVDGYSYEKPRDLFRVPNEEPQKWVDFNISRPAYIDESIYYTPTTTIAPFVPKAKAVKTFYYYNEPERQVPTTVAPPIPQSYYTTTRAPPRYYEAPRRPASPLGYFYITEPPPTPQTSTIRPPVYEYSYTAPGYGTLEAPKLSGVTTAAPPPARIPSLEYDNYYDYGPRVPSTPAPPAAYAEVTTQPSLRPTTIRPPKTDDISTTRSPFILQTENPYHAYFTHQDYSLIDDITKKYFTIFGQKLNGDAPTTPIPADVTRRPTTRVKFPTESPLDHTTPHAPAYTPNYWSTPSPSPAPVYRYPQYSEYDYYDDSRGTDYGYQTIREYYDVGNRQQQPHSASLLQQPQLSYEGDTRVNTIRPYPSRDPNAEEFIRHNNNRYLTGPLKTQAAQSLRHDTHVNYVKPQRPKDPDAEEFTPTSQTYQQRPGQNVPYRGAVDYNTIDPESRQRLILDLYKELLGRSHGLPNRHNPPSLVHDTKVNDQFIGQNVTPDPDAEVFDPAALSGRSRLPASIRRDPSPVKTNSAPDMLRQVQQFTADGRAPSGVIAYRLPGNGGGHFYFLTPQAAAQQDDSRQNLYRRNAVRRRQSGQNNATENNENKTPVKRDNLSAEQISDDKRTIER